MIDASSKHFVRTAGLGLALCLAWAVAAQAQAALRQVDRKLNAYATSEARAALGPLAKQTKNPKILIALGRILEQEKAYRESESHFRQAAQLAPADPAPWTYLGLAYRSQKRTGPADQAFAQAERRAQAAVAKNPRDAIAHYHLGVARQGLRKYGPAAASLTKASQLDPSNPMPFFQLGVTGALQGNWPEAIGRLSKALQMDSNLAYAYFYRGQAASRIKRKDMLIADLQRFLKLAPNAPEAQLAAQTLAAAKR